MLRHMETPQKVTLTKFDWEQIRALGFLNEQLERYYQYERTNVVETGSIMPPSLDPYSHRFKFSK